MAEQARQSIGESGGSNVEPFDYSYVPTVARVAVYDDLKMAPRIIEVNPAPTAEYIEKLADVIDEQKRRLGGKIPYSAIREVSENFIHARFTEVVVSILDGGNTIRFCDQGPGIKDKDKATLPGFTSAIEPMKHYIRGVGSGLPLVKEYLDLSHGKITIDDNLKTGAVVTISLEDSPSETPAEGPVAQTAAPTAEPVQPPAMPALTPTVAPVAHPNYRQQTSAYAPANMQRPYTQPAKPSTPVPPLTEREITALTVFAHEGALGVTELSHIAELPMSSTYNLMDKLEQNGLIEKTAGKKRILTDYGDAVYRRISEFQ